jgi:hypothetical protein
MKSKTPYFFAAALLAIGSVAARWWKSPRKARAYKRFAS